MDTTARVREARSHGNQLGQSRGFCWFARFGIAARGVVYIIMGLLAVLVGLGAKAHIDQRGALTEVLAQPFGTLLVVLLAVTSRVWTRGTRHYMAVGG